MKHSMLVAFASILAATAGAQVQSKVQAPLAPWFYDPYVRQLGLQQFPGGAAALEDRITAVEVLPDGAVLVAGYTYGALGEAHAGGSDTGDLFIARFNARGFRQWISQIGAVTGPTLPALNGNPSGPGGDAAQFESPGDIAVGADGSIFVVGSTTGSLGETNAGMSDVVLAKFNSSGAVLWLRQIGAETAPTILPEPGATNSGDASGSDWGSSIVVHQDGSVSIAGSTLSDMSEGNTNDTADFLLARFGASGDLLWVREMGEISSPMIGFDSSHSEYGARIALHPTGRLVLAGYKPFWSGTFAYERGIVMTFDDAGHPLEWVSLGDGTYLSSLAVHEPSGRMLVAGERRIFSLEGPNYDDAFAASLDADLNLQWMSRMDYQSTTHLGLLDWDGYEYVFGMRLDAVGDLILCGSTPDSLSEPNAGFADIFTAKIRGIDGHILWVSQIGQTTAAASGIDASGADYAFDLALGPAGTISLGGATTGSFGETNAGTYDALLLRLDRNGRLR